MAKIHSIQNSRPPKRPARSVVGKDSAPDSAAASAAQASAPSPLSTEIAARPTAAEIYESVEQNARAELKRTPKALALSGLAGGMGMGLTGIAVASAGALLGNSPSAQFAALLFYPLGFIAVVIGRAQLFTENTLYPVALILSERRHVLATARLWALVFTCNIAGAAVFAMLAVKTGGLHPEVARALVSLGRAAVAGEPIHIFWSGVIGGWIIALMAWIVSGSSWTIGQVVVIWALTVVVGMGRFAHCIASSGEILSAVFSGLLSLRSYALWLLSATTGNIAGGVVFVTLLNFGQVSDTRSQKS
jgi:formate/nitrite transporter FocA (FNT family)